MLDNTILLFFNRSNKSCEIKITDRNTLFYMAVTSRHLNLKRNYVLLRFVALVKLYCRVKTRCLKIDI